MRVKNIVKVMNMHALIRVEATKKEAEKYIMLENEVNNMIDNIVNNRNFKLDKKLISLKKNKPALNIFIGSDRGFCGSYNFQINKAIGSEVDSDKIIIGKKVMRDYKNIVLSIKKDDFDLNLDSIINEIYNSILNKKNSEINIIYFRYNKVGDLKLVKKRIFPLDNTSPKENVKYSEDFLYEGDITSLLLDLIMLYIRYEIILANNNSKASENIMRQENTSDSLKKIEEHEEVKKREERKIKKKKEFEKVLSNFTKLKID